jgi:hypothetical protein
MVNPWVSVGYCMPCQRKRPPHEQPVIAVFVAVAVKNVCQRDGQAKHSATSRVDYPRSPVAAACEWSECAGYLKTVLARYRPRDSLERVGLLPCGQRFVFLDPKLPNL